MAYHSTRSRRRRNQRVGTFEMLCVLVVLAAAVFVVTWMVQAGGGHYMF